MAMERIGVMLDGFRKGLVESIEQAKALGAAAVQIGVARGEAAPENLSAAQRREILARIKDAGMIVSAVCGDFGGHGLAKAEENGWRLEAHRRQMELARDWECEVLTSHIGVIPQDKAHPRYAVMAEAMGRLAEYGKESRVRIAIETGPEKPETLAAFVDSFPGGYVGVNFDPANLVMVLGVDPVEAVKTLSNRILHVHAKDGKMLRYVGAEKVYGFFAEGGIDDERIEECFIETPLGEGDVDFPRLIEALRGVGYRGAYTIEREVGDDPAGDIGLAVRFLKKLLQADSPS